MKVSLVLVSIVVSLILLVNISQTESLQKKGASLLSSSLSAFSSSTTSTLTSSVSTFASGVSNTSRGVISSLRIGHFRAGLKTDKKKEVVPGKPIYGRFTYSLFVSFGLTLTALYKVYKLELEIALISCLLGLIIGYIFDTAVIYAIFSLFDYDGPVYTREMFEDIEEFEKNELGVTASKEGDKDEGGKKVSKAATKARKAATKARKANKAVKNENELSSFKLVSEEDPSYKTAALPEDSDPSIEALSETASAKTIFSVATCGLMLFVAF